MINDVRSISSLARTHTDEGREEEKGEDRCLCSALVLREELEQVLSLRLAQSPAWCHHHI